MVNEWTSSIYGKGSKWQISENYLKTDFAIYPDKALIMPLIMDTRGELYCSFNDFFYWMTGFIEKSALCSSLTEIHTFFVIGMHLLCYYLVIQEKSALAEPQI